MSMARFDKLTAWAVREICNPATPKARRGQIVAVIEKWGARLARRQRQR